MYCDRLFMNYEGDLVYDPSVEPIRRAYIKTNIASAKSDIVTFLFEDENAFLAALSRWNQSTNDYRFAAISGLVVSG